MNKIGSYWLLGISIIMLGTTLFLNISQSVITNESIVLTFVGILATFIVVGNYAQVTEIRNSTNKEIKSLELKTQSKIDELNVLFKQISKASEKLSEHEKNIYYAYGESSRLFGFYTYDKGQFRVSTSHFISSIESYNKANRLPEFTKDMLTIIIGNLQDENWNKVKQTTDFDFEFSLKEIKNLPDTYTQKKTVIELLTSHQEKEKEKGK